MVITNILTIDLEEWFHSNLLEELSIDRKDPALQRVEANTERLLALLGAHGAKATFFVLGWVADRYPSLVRRIREEGHELASHGYSHRIVYRMTPDEFAEDVARSVEAIRRAADVAPIGFRAPSWSVTKETKWIYPILRAQEFMYDASVFPVKNFLYGIPDAPRFPYEVDAGDGRTMLEFPTTTLRVAGRNLPFSGGFYFRALPYAVIRAAYRNVNRAGRPVMFYLHPRDFDAKEPRVEGLNARDRLIHYYGVGGCFRKLERLLSEFRFGRVDHYFNLVAP